MINYGQMQYFYPQQINAFPYSSSQSYTSSSQLSSSQSFFGSQTSSYSQPTLSPMMNSIEAYYLPKATQSSYQPTIMDLFNPPQQDSMLNQFTPIISFQQPNSSSSYFDPMLSSYSPQASYSSYPYTYPPNNIQSAFNIIDSSDSNPYSGKLDNQYNRGFYPYMERTEQSERLLNNFYDNVSTNPWYPESSYQMNQVGKEVAGEDGKISFAELKALDTNNDNKISQEEYDAIKDNPIKKAFNIIDKRDANPNSGKLDSTYSRPIYPYLEKTEQSEAILNNLYEHDDNNGRLGVEKFKFNEKGSKVAGEDGKISFSELKALDTNNDNEISQAEYDAIPVDPPAQESFDTNNLIKSIISADTNNDGQSSRQEIKTKTQNIQGKIDYFSLISQYLPGYQSLVNQYKEEIKPYNLVNNNYDAFSDAGKTPDIDLQGKPIPSEHQIDGKSLVEIVTSALSDGNINDFSSDDLANLWAKVANT